MTDQPRTRSLSTTANLIQGRVIEAADELSELRQLLEASDRIVAAAFAYVDALGSRGTNELYVLVEAVNAARPLLLMPPPPIHFGAGEGDAFCDAEDGGVVTDDMGLVNCRNCARIIAESPPAPRGMPGEESEIDSLKQHKAFVHYAPALGASGLRHTDILHATATNNRAAVTCPVCQEWVDEPGPYAGAGHDSDAGGPSAAERTEEQHDFRQPDDGEEG